MCITQDIQLEEKSGPLDRKDIAQALHKRNLLRMTDSTQISPNDILFHKIFYQTNMETLCTEGLTLSENIKIYFKPDFEQAPRRAISFISFLNVPLETEGKDMT